MYRLRPERNHDYRQATFHLLTVMLLISSPRVWGPVNAISLLLIGKNYKKYVTHLWKEILLSDPYFKKLKFRKNNIVTVKVAWNISDINKRMNYFNSVSGYSTHGVLLHVPDEPSYPSETSGQWKPRRWAKCSIEILINYKSLWGK
jgi:hypothetical protein